MPPMFTQDLAKVLSQRIVSVKSSSSRRLDFVHDNLEKHF